MSIVSIIFILLIYSTLSSQPIIPKPGHTYHSYYLNKPLLQGSGSSLEIIKSSLNTKLKVDGEETTYSFTLKAQGLPSNSYYNSYYITFGKEGTYKLLNVEFKKKTGECSQSGSRFQFTFKLFNNEELDVILTYQIENKNLFDLYRFDYVALSFGKGYPGSMIITVDNKLSLLGTQNGILTKSDNGYIWSGIIPSNGLSDFVIVGINSIKWKSHYKGILTSNQLFWSQFVIPKYLLGGNNKFSYYEISNNHGNTIDGVNIVEKNTTFVLTQNNVNKAFYQVDADFSTSISFDWNVPIDFTPAYTATEATKIKAQEILASDTSGELDYIVLGRWVYNNMNYDLKYVGSTMSIDDILTNLKGVCEHFTKLYNALLQSIGINAIYTSGYGFNQKSALNYPDSSRHAWTVAQINGKWIPLDATWGIFDGKLPLSHVYESYEKSGVSWRYTKSCSLSQEHNLEYLGYDSSYSNVNLLKSRLKFLG